MRIIEKDDSNSAHTLAFECSSVRRVILLITLVKLWGMKNIISYISLSEIG